MKTTTRGDAGPEQERRASALRTKLTELLGTRGGREELAVEYLADPIDQLKSMADRAVAVQRLDQRARLIHDVRSALRKVEGEMYGICEECEEEIAAKRLDAVPWARLCVRCQSEAESGAREIEVVMDRAA